jgi:hypothetical protein
MANYLSSNNSPKTRMELENIEFMEKVDTAID